MKYLFIEPHADDLLFSAHTIMKKRFSQSATNSSDDILHVMTISNSSVTGELRSSNGYCQEMGYEYIGGENIPQIFFQKGLDLIFLNEEKITNEQDVRNLYLEWFRDIKDCIKSRILDILNTLNIDGGIYYCYGILHPAHVLTRCAIDEITQNKRIDKYCVYDIPYCNMELARKLYSHDSIRGKGSITLPNVKEKRILLYKYYPTEVYMLGTTSNILQAKEYLVEPD